MERVRREDGWKMEGKGWRGRDGRMHGRWMGEGWRGGERVDDERAEMGEGSMRM